MDGRQPNRDFKFPNLDVGRHAPSAFAFVLEAKHQHGQAVKREAPNDAKSVSLTQHVNIAAAEDNREQLQADDQIDNAVAGAELLMGTTEPVGKHAVFRNPVQHAIGADDRGVDGPGKNQETDHNYKNAKYQLQNMGADHEHRHARDQIVFIDRDADIVGNDHHGQKGTDAGKDEAEDRDDQSGTLQVAQLGTGDFTVYLGQRFFAAHGEHRVPERYENSEQADRFPDVGVFQKAQRFSAEVKILRERQWGKVAAVVKDGIESPAHQDDYHHCGDLHDAESFVTGFFNALEVFPPVVNSYEEGKGGGGVVFVEVRRAMKHGVHGAGNPAMSIGGGKSFIHQAGDVLSRGNAGDGAGEDIVKHQRGNAEFGKGPAERFFHHAVDAAAREH